jgi:hypothetical protein
MAAQACGFQPKDTIYDVIRKPQIVPMLATPEEDRKYTQPTKQNPIPRLYKNQRETDETPEEYGERLTEEICSSPEKYFQRRTIVRLDRDTLRHLDDLAQTIELIQISKKRDLFPRSPGSCVRYRRLCEFHDVCSGLATIDDARFERKDRKHEELNP